MYHAYQSMQIEKHKLSFCFTQINYIQFPQRNRVSHASGLLYVLFPLLRMSSLFFSPIAIGSAFPERATKSVFLETNPSINQAERFSYLYSIKVFQIIRNKACYLNIFRLVNHLCILILQREVVTCTA